jgi:hypothetical protein
MLSGSANKGHSTSWPTHLQMGVKDGINDMQRIDMTMDYLQQLAVNNGTIPEHGLKGKEKV